MCTTTSHHDDHCFTVEQSLPLSGTICLEGAKNAALPILASLILTSGISILRRVPPSVDISYMIRILEALGATVVFDQQKRTVSVNTRAITSGIILDAALMGSFRASTLILGPLLARFGHAVIAFPGGDAIGKRPIDFHIRAFQSMGALVTVTEKSVSATAPAGLRSLSYTLEYPSVGATENILMAAARLPHKTVIYNAALEPEVQDLGRALTAMGAVITYSLPGTITIEGLEHPQVIDYSIMYDRLEAGTFLLAAAATKGSVEIPDAPADHMRVFLEKLKDMGHTITVGAGGMGVSFTACTQPRAVNFRTMPYPGFPTDLQAPMAVVQALACGTSIIHETVYEARFSHLYEMSKMGALVSISGNNEALIQGGTLLRGLSVSAGDIRAAAALMIAGLAASGRTHITGKQHIMRGYVNFFEKLVSLGASIIPCVRGAEQQPLFYEAVIKQVSQI